MNNKQNLTVIFGKEKYSSEEIFYVNEEFFTKKLMDENSHKEAILFLEKIQESIINKNGILELFEYGNTSLWWFLYPTLFPKIKTTILFLKNFNVKKIISFEASKINYNYLFILSNQTKLIPTKELFYRYETSL